MSKMGDPLLEARPFLPVFRRVLSHNTHTTEKQVTSLVVFHHLDYRRRHR